MIDYVLHFSNETAAITAATGTALGQNNPETGTWVWNTHFVLPNVQGWRISQDNADGSHNYLAGWYCVVSVLHRNAQLDSNAALQFCLDRDGPPYVLINNIGAVISDVASQPVFAGSHYPIGGIS